MDPLSALACGTQLAAQCSQCVLSIVKWIVLVRTVDSRLNSFQDEVQALQFTYDKLKASLNAPLMLVAAHDTDRDSGGDLWSQIAVILKDCQNTMIAINQILGSIHSTSKIMAPIIKTLRESLLSGDLARLRKRIQLFNINLALPLQMINITLQLQLKTQSESNQTEVLKAISSMKMTVDSLAYRIGRPIRTHSWAGTAVLVESSAEGIIYENMEVCTRTANSFLSNASATASDKPTTSTVSGAHLTAAKKAKIYDWAELWEVLGSPRQVGDSGLSTVPPEAEAESELIYHAEDNKEIELKLTIAFFQNGQDDRDQEDYANAEENFREALKMLQEHDFGKNLAFHATDATLMVAECCIKQSKYDKAIELLLPIADMEKTSAVDISLPVASSSSPQPPKQAPDLGLSYTASHLLAEAYFNIKDFPNADMYAQKAFRGRNSFLRERDGKYRETVLLLIEIQQAMGYNSRARAYANFLDPPANNKLTPQTSHTEEIEIKQTSLDPTRSESVRSISSPKKSKKWFLPLRRTTEGEVPRASGEYTQLSAFTDTSLAPSGSGASTRLGEFSKHSSVSDATSSYPALGKGVDETAKGEVLRHLKLRPRFDVVRSFCAEGKDGFAIDAAMKLLREYDTDNQILRKREAQIKKNIKKGGEKGLAATGHGYAAIHFFCDLTVEATVEVELLLEQGADVNASAYKPWKASVDPRTPLQYAVRRGHTNIVRTFLDAKVSLKSRKISVYAEPELEPLHPLLDACLRGHAEIVSQLLEHGATLDEHDFRPRVWHGNSLLHEASWRSDLAMMRLFLEHGRRLSARGKPVSFVGTLGQQDSNGMTPLMYVLDCTEYTDERSKAEKLRKRFKCAQLLLDRGLQSERYPSDGTDSLQAPTHLKDADGRSAFWYAAQDEEECLTKLLKSCCAEMCEADPEHDQVEQPTTKARGQYGHKQGVSYLAEFGM